MVETVILLIHDVAAERKRLQRVILEGLPAKEVVAVSGARGALKVLREVVPDCAVIALEKSGEASIALCRQIRQEITGERIPTVLVALPEHGIQVWEEASKADVDDVVVPPFEDAGLLSRIHVTLRMKRMDEELRAANKRLAELASQRSMALRESEDRYRMLFNATGDAVVLFEISADKMRPGAILEVNEQTCRMLGYDSDELVGSPVVTILDMDRIDAVTVRMESLFKHHQVQFETVLVTKSGRLLPVGIVARLCASENRTIALAVVRQQQESKAGAPLSPDGESRYEIVADRTGQLVYDYNLATDSIKWIGAVSRVTGYSREEIDGVNFEHLLTMIHPEDRDRVRQTIREAVLNVGAYHAEYRLRHKSGSYRYLEDEGLALPGDDGRAYRVLGTARDITARAMAEQERKRFELEVQHSQRLESLGVLAGGIAHDFNNILAAIIGLTDMALLDLDPHSDTYADLREALQAAHRAKELVKQILAFSRQTGAERLPLYLHVVIREAMKLARATLPTTIEIIDDVDVHTGVVEANAAQMHQVFMNFCTNSAYAMRERGGRIIVTLRDVEVDERMASSHPRLKPGPHVRLSVTDNGYGMTPDILKRVFDPFFTTKGPGEGTGMGLSVVHGIITSHEGAVVAESAPGQGTTFHVYLPRVVSAVKEDKRIAEDLPRGQGRILFVDDEEAVRHFGKTGLERLGYEVVAAASGQQALEFFDTDPCGFDVLITDQVMPRMTGDELVTALRQRRCNIPAILFTGFGEYLTEDRAARAGIHEIVTKPVVVHDLDRAIRRLLQQKESG